MRSPSASASSRAPSSALAALRSRVRRDRVGVGPAFGCQARRVSDGTSKDLAGGIGARHRELEIRREGNGANWFIVGITDYFDRARLFFQRQPDTVEQRLEA